MNRPTVAVVRVEPGMSIDQALRKLKRACDGSGVRSELRRHEAYMKPCERRKLKSVKARKREAKLAARAAAKRAEHLQSPDGRR